VLTDLLANQAKAPLPVSVTTRSGSAKLAEGSLVFIDSLVDAATGQIKLKASFTNQDRKLWPGELVNARVLIRTDSQRLAVPSRAVVNTLNGPQIYTVDPRGAAQLRPVSTGVSVDGMTEVKSGIAANDLIVFDGQSRLNPGTHVAASMIAATAAAPGTTATSAAGATVGDPS
jgi:membrane fusion protein, multidrug efflux system